MDQLGARIRQAALYVGDVLWTACIPWVIGAMAGAVPLSFLSNWMGGGLAKAVPREGSVQAVQIIPFDWPDAVIHGKDDASYYLFFLLRVLLLFSLSFASYAVIILFWIGRKKRIFAIPLLLGFLLAGLQLVRVHVYASGTLRLDAATDAPFLLALLGFTVPFGIGSLVMAAQPGHRQTTIWPCSKIVLSQLFSYLAIARVNMIAGNTAQDMVRLVCLWSLAVIRGVAMHVTFYSSMQISGFSAHACVFTNIMAMALPSAGVAQQQLSSGDSAWAVLRCANMTVSEVFKNGALLCGMTEVDAFSHFISRLRRQFGSTADLVQVIPEPTTGARTDNTAVADAPTHDSDEQRLLLVQLATASNGLELVALLNAGVLFLGVKINPWESGGAPARWSRLVLNVAVGVLAELLSDFLTVVYVGAEASLLHARIVRAREMRTWALSLAMNWSVVVSTLEAFMHVISNMCVWPVLGSADLKSISACPLE